MYVDPASSGHERSVAAEQSARSRENKLHRRKTEMSCCYVVVLLVVVALGDATNVGFGGVNIRQTIVCVDAYGRRTPIKRLLLQPGRPGQVWLPEANQLVIYCKARLHALGNFVALSLAEIHTV